jgi:hypothetical protein
MMIKTANMGMEARTDTIIIVMMKMMSVARKKTKNL